MNVRNPYFRDTNWECSLQRIGGDDGAGQVGLRQQAPAGPHLALPALAFLLRGRRDRDGGSRLGVHERDDADHVADELAVERQLARERALVPLQPTGHDAGEGLRIDLPQQVVERAVGGCLAVVRPGLVARQAQRLALLQRQRFGEPHDLRERARACHDGHRQDGQQGSDVELAVRFAGIGRAAERLVQGLRLAGGQRQDAPAVAVGPAGVDAGLE